MTTTSHPLSDMNFVDNSDNENWVPFETSATFTTAERQTPKDISIHSNYRRRTSNESSMSWMNTPIDGDSSCIPVPPPLVEEKDTIETNRKRDLSRERASAIQTRVRYPIDSPPVVQNPSSRQPPPRSPMSIRPRLIHHVNENNIVEVRESTEAKRIRATSQERASTNISSDRNPIDYPPINQRFLSHQPPPRSPMSTRLRSNHSINENGSAQSGANPASSSSSSDSSSSESLKKVNIRSRCRSIDRATTQQEHEAMSSSRTRDLAVPSAGLIHTRGRSTSRTSQAISSPRAQSNTSKRIAVSPQSSQDSGRRFSDHRSSVTPTTIEHSNDNILQVPRGRSTSITHRACRSSDRPPPTPRSNSIGPGLPPRPKPPDQQVRDAHMGQTLDVNIGRNITFGKSLNNSKGISCSDNCRSGILNRLFGDHPGGAQNHVTSSLDSPLATFKRIYPRTLLSATVYHNTATNLWIATINTNQKGVATDPRTAARYLKAFSFPTERQAYASAIANAPPKMIHTSKSPCCVICSKKFTVFKRAGHCRNCGVCVCSNCTTFWSSKSVPETYNLKKESRVKICKSCDEHSSSFKQALLHGNYRDALELYSLGNINLRVPTHCRSKDEKMYPIHCAVDGGNIDILRWLIEEKFCPIKKTMATKNKNTGRTEHPIPTSKGRTILSIAMNTLNVDIIRYLVVEFNVSVFETKDLKVSLRALEAVLLALPQRSANACITQDIENGATAPKWDDDNFSVEECDDYSSLGKDDESALFTNEGDASTIASRAQSEQTMTDVCIICYDNSIDCVITPCGHQICCLKCSTSMKCCPVCSARCEFIKIFRP